MPFDDSTAALVQALGDLGLTLFFALLALLLPTATLLWWLVQRYAVPSKTSTLPAGAFLLIRLAAGFAVLVGAAAVFVSLPPSFGVPPSTDLALLLSSP